MINSKSKNTLKWLKVNTWLVTAAVRTSDPAVEQRIGNPDEFPEYVVLGLDIHSWLVEAARLCFNPKEVNRKRIMSPDNRESRR